MRERRDVAALSGPAFAVLAIVGNLLQGSVPKVHEEPDAAVSFYLAKSTSISVGMMIALLGVVLLMWFLGVLRDRLVGSGGPSERLAHIAFAGGIAGSALLAAGLAVNAAGALRARSLDAISDDVAVVFFDGSFVLMGLAASVGFAVTMLATGASVLQTGVLPRWVGWLSYVFAVPGLVAPVAWVLLILFPLWAAIVGLVLARSAAAGSGAESQA